MQPRLCSGSECCEAYLKVYKKGRADLTMQRCRQKVYHFHRWLETERIDLRELNPKQIEAYWCYLGKGSPKEIEYQEKVKPFLRWAATKGWIRRSTVELGLAKPTIECCEAYLTAHKRAWSGRTITVYRQKVYHFHRWLETERIDLRELDPKQIEAYWCYLGKGSPREIEYQEKVKPFLRWAATEDWIRRGVTELGLAKPTIECCEAYLTAYKRAWTVRTMETYRSMIYRFHRWLDAERIDLRELDPKQIEAFWRYLGKGSPKEIKYRKEVKAFLRWAAAEGWIRRSAIELGLAKPTHPWVMEHAREIESPYIKKFLRIYVGEFYDWAERAGVRIEVLTRGQIHDYERHLRNSDPPRGVATRRLCLSTIRTHLRWLCGRKMLKTSVVELGIARRKRQPTYAKTQLPSHAKNFLRLMAAQKRPGTVRRYQSQLRHFLDHLNRCQLDLNQFSRLDFEDYLASMHRDGYAPGTRCNAITAVQGYLIWLFESGYLAKDPEPTIINFPRPRLPDYLPRDLPPDADRLVQERLEARGDVDALALLLMRRTGVRIGDLMALSFDCVREDPDGHAYMKVPIGKLYNERFVPLDDKTLAILKRVKALSLENNVGRKPEKLVIRPHGKTVKEHHYRLVLYEIDEELRLDAEVNLGEEPLVSHRFRHTYATSLLAAGLSIEEIKELLGHRDFKMSLRYARVTPQKLRSDYLKAIASIEGQVTPPELVPAAPDAMTASALDELLALLRGKLRDGHPDRKRIKALIRRIERARAEFREID